MNLKLNAVNFSLFLSFFKKEEKLKNNNNYLACASKRECFDCKNEDGCEWCPNMISCYNSSLLPVDCEPSPKCPACNQCATKEAEVLFNYFSIHSHKQKKFSFSILFSSVDHSTDVEVLVEIVQKVDIVNMENV